MRGRTAAINSSTAQIWLRYDQIRDASGTHIASRLCFVGSGTVEQQDRRRFHASFILACDNRHNESTVPSRLWRQAIPEEYMYAAKNPLVSDHPAGRRAGTE